MNDMILLSSGNNFNEGNLTEKSVASVKNFFGSQMEDPIDIIPAQKKTPKYEQEEEKKFQDNEEAAQEKKDLYDEIKATGQIIQVKDTKSIHDILDDKMATGIKCSSYFDGYEKIGKGGQGRVLRLRRGNNTNIAVKLYEKSKEKEFMTEVDILDKLKLSSGGGLGILDVLVTPTDFGIVFNGGAGSLLDFRNYLIQNYAELTEKELLCMLTGIMRNYEAIRSISVLHRDIKPDYVDSRQNWPGGRGTRGFTKPDFMDCGKTFTKEELLKGDYYSIAITILSIADLEFNPQSMNMTKEVDRSMEKIGKLIIKFSNLHRVLNYFLKGEDLNSWGTVSKLSDDPRGYHSGLSEHKVRFLQYMQQKEDEKNFQAQEEIKRVKNFEPILSQDIFDDFLFEKQSKTLKQLKVQADNSFNNNEITEALSCYGLILQNFIQKSRNHYSVLYSSLRELPTCNSEVPDSWKQAPVLRYAEPFFDKIYSIINSGYSGQHNLFDPLLYSTLGVYSYLRKDFELAKIFLRKGVEVCEEKFGMLILRSNYGYICSERGYFQEDDYAIIDNIQGLLKDTTQNFSPNQILAQRWMRIHRSIAQKFFCISNAREEGKYEILLAGNENEVKGQKDSFLFENFENDEDQLKFVAFTNLCKSRSDLLESLLRKKSHELLLKIQHLCFLFKREYWTWISFNSSLRTSLEIFAILLQFNNILQNYHGWDLSYNEIRELKEASDLFDKNKNEMKQLFEEETEGILFKIFFENNLLIALTGFILKSSGSHPEDKIQSTFVSDYLKIKFDILLQNEGSVEIYFSMSKKLPHSNHWDRFSVLKSLFNSDFVLDPQMAEIDFLRQIGSPLKEFQYRIQADPFRKTKKYRMSLIHMKISEATEVSKNIQLPLNLEAHKLESLRLLVTDASIFNRGEMLLEEILASNFLLKLSIDIFKNEEEFDYSQDYSVKILTKFVSSLKLPQSLEICIFDSDLASKEGISFFEEIIKKLSDQKFWELNFDLNRVRKNSSIQVLIGIIEKFSKLEKLVLKFKKHKRISFNKVVNERGYDIILPFIKENSKISVESWSESS